MVNKARECSLSAIHQMAPHATHFKVRNTWTGADYSSAGKSTDSIEYSYIYVRGPRCCHRYFSSCRWRVWQPNHRVNWTLWSLARDRCSNLSRPTVNNLYIGRLHFTLSRVISLVEGLSGKLESQNSDWVRTRDLTRTELNQKWAWLTRFYRFHPFHHLVNQNFD